MRTETLFETKWELGANISPSRVVVAEDEGEHIEPVALASDVLLVKLVVLVNRFTQAFHVG